MVGRGGVRVADRVDDHLGQVDRLVVQRPPRVEAGQQEEVVDERRHSDGLGLDPADRAGDSLGDRLLLAAGQLGIPADRGQRSPQLVARIGDELADPLLALLPLVEGVVDVIEHLVECGAHLSDLRAGVGVLGGYSLHEGDLALRQGELATRVAVAATRSSGRRLRRTSHMPPRATSKMPAIEAIPTSHPICTTVRCVGDNGRPTITVALLCRLRPATTR